MYEIYEKLRDEKGFNNSKVASLTGISPSSISEWKSGKYEPSLDNLYKLSKLFGVPIETFLMNRK